MKNWLTWISPLLWRLPRCRRPVRSNRLAPAILAAALCAPGLSGAPPSLSVVQPLVAQFDGGPSVPAGFAFAPGETLFLAFDIAGFQPEGEEDQQIRLSWQCQPFDGAGLALAKPLSGVVKVDLAPEDKKWRPRVRVEFQLPQGVYAGPAEIRINVRDLVASATAAATVPFRTRGPDPAGIDSLRPLRFRFLRSADSTQPLTVPAYRPGDTVWARFDIAGYRFGEGNSYQLSYGLDVLRANGEALFREEQAAAESGDSYYPRRYLPGSLSLQLTRDLAPGEYTIVLRIRDAIGKQSSETTHTFRVE